MFIDNDTTDIKLTLCFHNRSEAKPDRDINKALWFWSTSIVCYWFCSKQKKVFELKKCPHWNCGHARHWLERDVFLFRNTFCFCLFNGKIRQPKIWHKNQPDCYFASRHTTMTILSWASRRNFLSTKNLAISYPMLIPRLFAGRGLSYK